MQCCKCIGLRCLKYKCLSFVSAITFLLLIQIEESKDEQDWLSKISHWPTLHDYWVEKLWPHLRDVVQVKAMGVVGTGWGSYVATK